MNQVVKQPLEGIFLGCPLHHKQSHLADNSCQKLRIFRLDVLL